MSTKRVGIAEIEKQHGVLTFARLLKSHREREQRENQCSCDRSSRS